MQNLNQYLDNWHDFYYEKNNNFDPKIEILVQDYVMNKNKNEFEMLIEKNNLQNNSVGICICDFKKSDLAHEFYTWLEMITNNWQQFYKAHAGGKVYQNWCSMDLSSSIAAKIMNIETQITNEKAKNPSFVHMKPRIQNWQDNFGKTWRDRVAVYFDDDCTLTIGNYVQSGVFHYTDKDFVTNEMLKKYEKKIRN